MQTLFDIPCKTVANFLNLTLTPSNQIIHPARYYAIFRDWDGKRSYTHEELKKREGLTLFDDAGQRVAAGEVRAAAAFPRSGPVGRAAHGRPRGETLRQGRVRPVVAAADLPHEPGLCRLRDAADGGVQGPVPARAQLAPVLGGHSVRPVHPEEHGRNAGQLPDAAHRLHDPLASAVHGRGVPEPGRSAERPRAVAYRCAQQIRHPQPRGPGLDVAA
ncbi:hypothetical protein ON010_g12555 [Phytophthora cinnamomi]|nr:hypothetical protein ON010_g12555 [Phytophthora cinnamomi]